VVVCSIARLPYVLLLDKTPDTTYTEAILGVWSLVEVNLGIICACAMRFKRLIATYLPRLSLFSSQSRSVAKMGYDSRRNDFQSGDSKGRRSYQLHSIQNGSTDPFSVNNGISVYHSFNVDVKSSDKDIRDGGSTDRILT
jgi:hypothetical protein